MCRAKFYGVGVGPSDPELLTLKAVRYLQTADVLAFLSNEQGDSQALSIAEPVLDLPEQQQRLAIFMPMSTDRTLANQAYDKAAEQIKGYLEQGLTVAFFCEGDPLFYASFIYLLERVQEHYPTEVVPGISSLQAASARLRQPIVQQTESLLVLTGRHTEQQLRDGLLTADNLLIIKAGQARAKILKLLAETQRTEDASYLEYIGRDNEHLVRDVRQLDSQAGPYFSLFVVRKSADA